MCSLSSCSVTTPPSDQDVIGSLSKEQHDTLLNMLERYDSNQRAIDEWVEKEPSLSRLSEIETDLKTLIVQLSALSREQKQPSIAPEKKSESRVDTIKNSTAKPIPVVKNADTTVPQSEKRGSHEKNQTLNGFLLQLTALNSLSDLRKYWTGVSAKYPAIFVNRTPYYEVVTSENGTILYRLKFGMFKNSREASNICNKLHKTGNDCFIATNNSGRSLY